MKALTTILIVLLFQISAFSQTKVYFSTGTNTSTFFIVDGVYVFGKGSQVYVTDNEYTTKGLGNFWNAEVLVETRLNRVINGVTGVSLFQVGYDNKTLGTAYTGDFLSKLDIKYLGVPLFLRASFVNAVNLDVGFLANIPISAVLSETRNANSDTFGSQSYEDDIRSSLTSIHLGGYFSITLLINRYTLTYGFQSGQSKVDKEMLDSWPIGGGSLFLRDIYPKFRYQFGFLKLGIRLK